jgi:hypothetical protein
MLIAITGYLSLNPYSTYEPENPNGFERKQHVKAERKKFMD